MTVTEITSVCLLTPSGRGAVAVVAVEGEAAVAAVDRYFRAANKRALGEQPLGRILYGRWGSQEGEDLVVCRRDERALEIHCHGGQQSSTQIVSDLSKAGCKEVEATQWLARQHACPIAAAAHQAMSQATTFRTATILLAQYQGALRHEIESIIDDLQSDSGKALERIETLLGRAEFGRHLTQPWQVVIAGQPNVGKSSLINTLVGFERAIVYDQPGTTRDVVSASTAVDGWPVELSDTAGLHETSDAIETAGIELARQRLSCADLIVWVLDAAQIDPSVDWFDTAKREAEAVGISLEAKRTLLVINKVDLATVAARSPVVGTSTVDGTGIEQLLSEIAAQLVPSVPPPDAGMPFTTEQRKQLEAAKVLLIADQVDEARAYLQQALVASDAPPAK